MGTSGKLFLITVWCSILCRSSVDSQHFAYKHKDVNHYEIRNGKYRLIPTTTRAPSLMETFFPWTGNAYNSVRTPEEDAAILNSISDPDPSSSSGASSSSNNDGGLMSWFSMPGFGSSSNNGLSNDVPMMHPGMRPGPPGPPPPMMNYNGNMPMYGAASQNEPVVVPPPTGAEQFGGFSAPPSPSSPYPAPLPSQYPPPPPSQYPASPENYMSNPNEIRNNVNFDPTFQFHQQVKDSIPIPTPSLSNVGQAMFPYPYSAGSNLDFGKSTTEKSTSFLDVISNYFTFGKRSDFEEESSSEGENVMEARSMTENADAEEYETDEAEEGHGYEVELKEAPASASDNSTASASAGSAASAGSSSPPSAPSTDGKAFPCPKSGIWRWNGEVCIAVGPVPVWACRPNDLIVSGKIAICRNKIYFSPKVISNGIGQRVN